MNAGPQQSQSTLLKRAVIEQSAAKIALFGTGGSGKSLTATLIAIALSKIYHGGAPVVLQDTEGASDWLIPIYEAEGVELHRVKSKSFLDMRTTLREGGQLGACVFIDDSYSHPWQDLQKSLMDKLKVKKLEPHHRQELTGIWGEWVDQFLNSPLHCVLAGRVGQEWETDVDEETGKFGFHSIGTKMRSEKDAGYEPHLLLEMEAVRVMDELRTTGKGEKQKTRRVTKKAGGHFLHRMHVLKDRSRILNGKMFEFKDINNYKEGDWQAVYKVLKPHFDNMNIGKVAGNHAVNSTRTSAALFDDRGAGAYSQRMKEVTIALEEIQGTMAALWPGQDAASKGIRQAVLKFLFETYSWAAVEARPLDELHVAVDALKHFEAQTKGGHSALMDKVSCVELLGLCKKQATADRAARAEGLEHFPAPNGVVKEEFVTRPAPQEKTLAFDGFGPQ